METRIRQRLQDLAADAPTSGKVPPQLLRRARRRVALTVTSGVVIVLALVAGALAGLRTIQTTPTPADRPTPRPSPAASGEETDENVVVHGWPDTAGNRAGVYSWDGSHCASPLGPDFCVMGFMHNGYGSGDVEIRIEVVPAGRITDEGATAVTVAGHDGIYRRIDARREDWIVEIEGTTIAIRLDARPGTSEADLADAHAIIESMRTDPRNTDLGFRLVFTLTTNQWDSG